MKNMNIKIYTKISLAVLTSIGIVTSATAELMLGEITSGVNRLVWSTKKASEKMEYIPSKQWYNSGEDPMRLISDKVPGVQLQGGARPGASALLIRGMGNGGTFRPQQHVTFAIDGAISRISQRRMEAFRADPEIFQRVTVTVGGDHSQIGSAGGGFVNYTTKNPEDLLLDGQTRGYLTKFGIGSNGKSNLVTVAGYQKENRVGLLGQITRRSAGDMEVPFDSLKVQTTFSAQYNTGKVETHGSEIKYTDDESYRNVAENYKVQYSDQQHTQYLAKVTYDGKNQEKGAVSYTKYAYKRAYMTTPMFDYIPFAVQRDVNTESLNVGYELPSFYLLDKTKFTYAYMENYAGSVLLAEKRNKRGNIVGNAGDFSGTVADTNSAFKIDSVVKGINVGIAAINHDTFDQSVNMVAPTNHVITTKSYNRKIVGAYANKEIKIANGKTTITPSLKIEKADYSVKGMSAELLALTEQTKLSKTGTSVGLNLSHNLGDKWTLFGSAKSTETLPDGHVIFSASSSGRGDYRSSENVSPVKNNILMAGLGYSSPVNIMKTKGNFSFKLEVWQNKILKDLISQSSSDVATSRYISGPGVSLKGLDILMSYNWDSYTLDSNLSHMVGKWDTGYTTSKYDRDTRVTNIAHVMSGDYYQGAIPLTLNTTLTKEFADGDSLSYNIYHRGKMDKTPDDYSHLKREGYTLHNVYYTWKLESLDNTAIKLGIENVFDTAYEEANMAKFAGKGRDIRIEFVKFF